MAEFLHDQGQTGIQEQMKVRADAQTDFGNQEEHGDAHEIACTGHLFFIQDVEGWIGNDTAQYQCIEHWQEDDESMFLDADKFCHDDEQQGKHMDFPVFNKVQFSAS